MTDSDTLANLRTTAQTLLDRLPVGTYIMVLPPGATMAQFAFMSERFLELTGLDRATAASDPLKAFACVHPDDYAYWVQLNAEAFANKRPFFGEARVIVNGEVRWITAESRPRDLPDGSTVWEGVLIDITERKHFETALTEVSAAAEIANQAKSAFLANMSHEIRTPMTGIIGLAQLVLRGELNAQQRTDLETLEHSAQSLLGLLNDILDFSKIEAGKLVIEQVPLVLRQVVDDVLKLLERSALEKSLVLRIDLDPTLPPSYVGDPLRLKQVLTNLLGNAIKFTHQGEVQLSVAPGRCVDGVERLRFEVRDTGIGIRPEQQRALFEPFSQTDGSTTRQYGGTGLGLAISKQLVELMGGRLEVESRPGQGSCFRFEIVAPPVDAPAATIEPDPLPAGSAAPSLAGRRLLLVEDNAVNRKVVCGLLADTGVRIEVAENGLQAVELFQSRLESERAGQSGSQLPELILMDIQMPVMDGYEAARRIRALDDRVPIIALTANAFLEDIEKTHLAGMNAHLSKPIDSRRLKRLIHESLQPDEPADRAPSIPATVDTADADFPEIPGIDRDHARLMLEQDLALFLSLLQGFVEDFADLPARVAQALARDARADAARHLHSLRSIAGQLGALAFAASARRLEQRVQQGDTELDAPLAALDTELQALIAASAPWCRSADVAPPLPVSASPALGADATAETANDRGAGARLLIVDDTPLAVATLCRVLDDMGELFIATSGAEALEQVARTRFDLILLDACMPGMDGFETCRILHRDHPEIPVIFVTAANDFDSEVRALQAGALDFIGKPINPPVVRARVGIYLQLKAQSDRLRFLATTDRLTGLCNRLSFETRATEEIGRSKRYGMPLSLILFDIDHFKSINDRFGHLVGDRVLIEVARRVGRHLRAVDVSARWGGEEFTVMMPHCGRAEALKLAEKLRVLMADAPFVEVGTVTASFGVAEWAAGENLDQWVKRADDALYAAKAGGRNRVEAR